MGGGGFCSDNGLDAAAGAAVADGLAGSTSLRALSLK